VIDIPSELFTFGRALNVGAKAATAPVHMAVSSHCFLPRTDWVERCLAHYRDPRVAGTAGGRWLPGGEQLTAVLRRDREHTLAHPFWGFSNHASSWRASVWRQVPFDEGLPASEDQEWAWRVTGRGWIIAVDPELTVPAAHRWTNGAAAYFRRTRREVASMQSFLPMRYGVGELVDEWWNGVPRDSRHPAWAHRFLDYRRLAGLAGKYVGARGGLRPRRR
jgi:rhamnosyltransferase